jgi:[acyl-carrier-protein] S-malonyltransferase
MAVAWVFPGQGAQFVGMGRELYDHVPAARDVFDQADAAVGLDLTRMCFEGPETELTATENAQPALLTLSVALLRALEAACADALPLPAAVAGHSLGEYSALVAAGAFDLPTAVRLVRQRGELMAQAREGTMAAVMGLSEEMLDQICQVVADEVGQAVVIANYNAPGQFVISGATEAVQRAGVLAREQGARRVLPLKVSAAFHSPLMHDAARGMQQALADVTIADLHVPLFANVSAAPLTQAHEVRAELAAQITSPVRWVASVRQMAAQGVDTFVEIGPGAVLSGLIKRIEQDARLINLRDADDILAFGTERSV